MAMTTEFIPEARLQRDTLKKSEAQLVLLRDEILAELGQVTGWQAGEKVAALTANEVLKARLNGLDVSALDHDEQVKYLADEIKRALQTEPE